MLAGVLLGDGLGLMGLAWVMFKDRHKDRVFWFLAALFFSFTVYILLWVSAATEISTDVRTAVYRRGVLAASIVLALGIWPAVLHIIFGLWRNGKRKVMLMSGDQPADFWIAKIGQIVRDETLSPEALRDAIRAELQDFFRHRRG